MSQTSSTLNRMTGLLIIEVRDSNPNGDPDNEGDPRMRGHDKRGMISGVSFKRKLRDLVEEKEGPVWHALSRDLDISQKADRFQILESRGRKRPEIGDLTKDEFQQRFWDARVFGNTFLESLKDDPKRRTPAQVEHFIRSGAVQFSNGISVAPIRIERMTLTNKSGVEENKDRGMAPMAYRVVEHAIYVMPFFVNPTAAVKSGCDTTDLNLLKRLIPLAYMHNAANGRPNVGIRHAWLVEHKSPLGSASDFAIQDALMPTKLANPDQPSTNWNEYSVPTSLPSDLANRVNPIKDLTELK